ncbi:Dabb family protein [Microbacterium invictum]|uniref:Stress-response A/B barrel domain-containing protein n=1 Tax=Microbacterium invictum TaxID=515415 RepID=A0AA40SLB8_9MICO|nr:MULTISPECIES: Dabb family protein [Microbacterium]MBB4138336.1 hypothetical protein [Microbacterium invictum]
MSIQHTVVFRLVHPHGDQRENAFLADGRRILSSIPGVGDFTVQRQVSPKSALTHQFAMVFADDAAYAAYNAHPDHVAFVEERWATEVAEFQEYDFLAL